MSERVQHNEQWSLHAEGLSRKRIKREMCMLIIWGYFVLNYSEFLGGKFLNWVYVTQVSFMVSSGTLSVQVAYSQILNSVLMVNVTRCQWKHCPRICPQNIRKTPGTKIVTPPKYNELCCDIQLRDS
jgi:hypothetical protein